MDDRVERHGRREVSVVDRRRGEIADAELRSANGARDGPQPALSAHLRALGFSGAEISVALAIAPLFSLAVPLGWAWLADRTQRHDRVLRLIAFGAWLVQASLP